MDTDKKDFEIKLSFVWDFIKYLYKKKKSCVSLSFDFFIL